MSFQTYLVVFISEAATAEETWHSSHRVPVLLSLFSGHLLSTMNPLSAVFVTWRQCHETSRRKKSSCFFFFFCRPECCMDRLRCDNCGQQVCGWSATRIPTSSACFYIIKRIINIRSLSLLPFLFRITNLFLSNSLRQDKYLVKSWTIMCTLPYLSPEGERGHRSTLKLGGE